MKNKAKEYWPYAIVVLAIVSPWLFHPGYLFFTDMAWGPHIILDWTSTSFLANLIIKIFSFVLPVDIIQKLYLGLAVFVVLMGGKKLAELFISDKLAVFTVSLFALFNPFVYDRFMYGQANIVMALGFLLLSSGYLFQYLESKSKRTMLCYGIFAALSLQFSVHFIFFGGAVFILFLVLYFKKWGSGEWKISLKHLALAGAVVILLNINWLAAMPLGMSNAANFVGSSGLTHQDLAAFKTSGRTDLQVLGNVVMMSGFWGKDQYRYADLTGFSQNWGRSFLVVLPLVLYGVFLGLRSQRWRALSVGLLIVFVISVFLACGIAFAPAQGVSYWLFDHFPLYKGLRETQKWVSLAVMIYLFFLSIGVGGFLEFKVISRNRIAAMAFVAAVIFMQAPLLVWGFSGQVRPTPYPVDWQEVNSSLVCPNGEKALFLPWHMYMSFGWIGNIVGNPAQDFFKCPVISGSDMEWGGIYDNSGSQTGKNVAGWIGDKGNDGFFSASGAGVKYVILAKELDWRNYDWLDGAKGLTLSKETATLRLYETNE